MEATNMMNYLNLTVKEFADHYIPTNAKVRVVKSAETIFEGTLDQLYYSGIDILCSIVAMVGADEGFVCLSCRE